MKDKVFEVISEYARKGYRHATRRQIEAELYAEFSPEKKRQILNALRALRRERKIWYVRYADTRGYKLKEVPVHAIGGGTENADRWDAWRAKGKI